MTSQFPETEKFGLVNQLRRAPVSIPSNIAEGSSRTSDKEFSRFLQIAIGSAYEMETQMLIASDLKFIIESDLEPVLAELDAIIKMISRFKSTLNN